MTLNVKSIFGLGSKAAIPLAPMASGAKLPVELLEEVIESLTDSDLISSQTVSWQWRSMCERSAGLRFEREGGNLGTKGLDPSMPHLRILGRKVKSLESYKNPPLPGGAPRVVRLNNRPCTLIGDNAVAFLDNVRDGTTAELIHHFRGGAGMREMIVSPDGLWAVATQAYSFRKFSIAKKNNDAPCLFDFSASTKHVSEAWCIEFKFSSDSSTIAVYGGFHNWSTCQVLRSEDGFTKTVKISNQANDAFLTEALSPSGNLLAGCTTQGISIYGTKSGKLIKQIDVNFMPIGRNLDSRGWLRPSGCSFSADERYVAVAESRNVLVFDLHSDARCVYPLACLELSISSIEFSPSSNVLSLGLKDLLTDSGRVQLLELKLAPRMSLEIIQDIYTERTPDTLTWAHSGRTLLTQTLGIAFLSRTREGVRIQFGAAHKQQPNLKRSWWGTCRFAKDVIFKVAKAIFGLAFVLSFFWLPFYFLKVLRSDRPGLKRFTL